MPDDDSMLGQNLVDVRNEERIYAGRDSTALHRKREEPLTTLDRETTERELEQMIHDLGDRAGRVLPNPAARLKYEQWAERTIGEIHRLQGLLAEQSQGKP